MLAFVAAFVSPMDFGRVFWEGWARRVEFVVLREALADVPERQQNRSQKFACVKKVNFYKRISNTWLTLICIFKNASNVYTKLPDTAGLSDNWLVAAKRS